MRDIWYLSKILINWRYKSHFLCLNESFTFLNNVGPLIYICISIISLSVCLFTKFLLKHNVFHPPIVVLFLTPLPRHRHFNGTRHLTTVMSCRLSIQALKSLFKPSTLILLIYHEKKYLD